MEQFIDQLQSGETYEIPEIYIGIYQKLPARLILYKLTETQMKRRQKDLASKEHKNKLPIKNAVSDLVQLTFTLQIFLWNICQKNKYTIFIPYDGKLNLSLKLGNHFFVFIIVIL